MSEEARALVVEMAKTRMAVLRLTNVELASRAKVDRKTVNDFLAGKRWPRRSSLASISEALEYAPEMFEQVASGAREDGPVGGDVHDASQYVESSTGRLADRGITNEDLLREILRSRAESDQIRAEVRENASAIAALSERVVKLEQPRT